MASDDAAIVAEAARRLEAVADAHDCGRDGCDCGEGSARAWRQLAARFHGWPHFGYSVAPEHARILLAHPDAAALREELLGQCRGCGFAGFLDQNDTCGRCYLAMSPGDPL